jgi:hypothetical protein
MNVDERWNFFDTATALGSPEVKKKRLAAKTGQRD